MKYSEAELKTYSNIKIANLLDELYEEIDGLRFSDFKYRWSILKIILKYRQKYDDLLLKEKKIESLLQPKK